MPGIPFLSAAWRHHSSFDGVLKMAGDVLVKGLASLLWRFGPGVDGVGKAFPGCMKDATDENKEETAERAVISAELEDAELCARFRGCSDDLRFAGSNVADCGGLLTVATPSYWCIKSIYAPN
jgi:hypothetical protein